MIEDLVNIIPPPGYFNNGTVRQSRGRWFTGNFVRFFQKAIQPIGGWTTQSHSGATLTGTPNAMFAWASSSDNFVAIGTSSHLYVLSSSNVLYDITPSNFNNGGGTAYWQLDNFGTYLVATYNGSGTNPSGAVNGYYWAGNTGTAAQPIDSSVINVPFLFYGVITTPERFLVFLQGTDPDPAGGGDTTQLQFRATNAGALTTNMVT